MLCWWADGRLCGFYSSKMKFLNIPLLGLKQARTVVAPHLIKSATRAQKKKSTTRKFKAHKSAAQQAQSTRQALSSAWCTASSSSRTGRRQTRGRKRSSRRRASKSSRRRASTSSRRRASKSPRSSTRRRASTSSRRRASKSSRRASKSSKRVGRRSSRCGKGKQRLPRL